MSRLIKRGYDADAIKWVVTRGYSIGSAAPVSTQGRVERTGIRRGLAVGIGRGVAVGVRKGLRVGLR